MLKIELIPMPQGPKIVIEAEDADANCLRGIEQKVRELELSDG